MSNEPRDVFTLYTMDVEEGECWPWRGAWGGRSRTLRPYYTANGVRKIAYRWVYELINGIELTSEQQIRHSCDNGGHPIGCGNPQHMAVGSNKDNVDDRTERERWGLPHQVVRAIRTLARGGTTQADIAERYGLHPTTVSKIISGDRYGNVS